MMSLPNIKPRENFSDDDVNELMKYVREIENPEDYENPEDQKRPLLESVDNALVPFLKEVAKRGCSLPYVEKTHEGGVMLSWNDYRKSVDEFQLPFIVMWIEGYHIETNTEHDLTITWSYATRQLAKDSNVILPEDTSKFLSKQTEILDSITKMNQFFYKI